MGEVFSDKTYHDVNDRGIRSLDLGLRRRSIGPKDSTSARFAGTIQEQIVDEEWRQPQQIEESYCFPAAIARTQYEWSNPQERSP